MENLSAFLKKLPRNVDFITQKRYNENMEKVYTASDLIFTRAGGSTISEQITKQVPIVFRENLIINERINKKLFVSLGAGVSMGKISDAAKILQDVLKNRNLLKNIKNCQKTLKQENSTFNIADFIIKTS